MEEKEYEYGMSKEDREIRNKVRAERGQRNIESPFGWLYHGGVFTFLSVASVIKNIDDDQLIIKLLIIVIAIIAGSLYYPLKSKIKIKFGFIRSVVTWGIIFFLSNILIFLIGYIYFISS